MDKLSPEVVTEIKHLKEVQMHLQKQVALLQGEPVFEAVRDSTLLVMRDARINAPVDTGRLRASIVPAMRREGDTIMGVVGSNVEYAPHMEFGTRPHWPPRGALAVWARRHGIPEFVVARSIAVKGLAERRFLRGAFEKNAEAIKRRIEQAIKKVVKG